jgi:hypothetical protein
MGSLRSTARLGEDWAAMQGCREAPRIQPDAGQVRAASTPVHVSPTRLVPVFGWLSAGEVYWQDTSRKLWSATVSSKDGSIEVGTPRPMFVGLPSSKELEMVAYDILRERFLIAIEESAREAPQLIFVRDWRPESVLRR